MAAEQQKSAPPVAGMSGTKIVPGHVPPELVRELNYRGPHTLVDPFSVTDGIFEDYPPVFFWPRPMPGAHDGLWVVTRYQDIQAVYRNDVLYSTENTANFQATLGETFKSLPISASGAEHARYRIFLNPWFSPKSIAALEPQIRQITRDLIGRFVDAGECDVAFDYGRLYPVLVFLNLMGLPEAKLEDFLQWEYALLHSKRDPERIKWGTENAVAYLRSFIEEVRAQPDEKLTSAIVHGVIDGQPLTDDEIIGTIFFLWVAGLDSVAANSSLMFRRLALEPHHQKMLRENPAMIPEAIEEFLRTQPVVNSARVVKQDHTIHGVSIRKGDSIATFNMSGNFDPEEFGESARELKLDRSPNRHMSLGHGAHRCLGSHLARRELQIALDEFLRRVPPFRMKAGADLSAYTDLLAAPSVQITWDS